MDLLFLKIGANIAMHGLKRKQGKMNSDYIVKSAKYLYRGDYNISANRTYFSHRFGKANH
jgi:hypothetical protein